MDKNFGGIIWTNHALQRLKERGIKQSDALATWRNPDQSRPATASNSWIYYKTYGNEKIEVVASKNNKGEWVVLSVWSRPVWDKGGKTETNKAWDNFLEKILNILFGWARR